ncbi:MAG: 5-Nucleotidase domain protein [Frankiales bacterium]|nr:5-Nucleotidase domain protein [Frankiales bacterium]
MSRTSRSPRTLAAGVAGLLGLALLTVIGAPASYAGSTLDQSSPASTGPKVPKTVELQLLAINDLHGNLEPPSGSSGRVVTGATDSGGPVAVAAGGVAYLADHLDRLRDDARHSLTVAAGDMVGASPLTSALFHDEPTIEALDLLGLDVTAVGNHEFDEGVEELLRLQEGGCHPIDGCQTGHRFRGADFPYLAANVVDRVTGRPILPPYEIQKVKGVKVGFIGMTLEGTDQIVSPSGIANVRFLDEAETANRYVAELKSKGVESIVVLLHEGATQAPDPTFQNSLYDDCDNLNGPLVDIVKAFDDEIDVVISGHTHQAYNCSGASEIDGKLVTSAASFGRIVTDLRLTLDRRTKDVLVARAENVVVSRDSADPELQELVDYYKAKAAPLADRQVGQITESITRTGTDDTPLGNLIADSQLAATSTAATGGAVAAFMNPGGVRADLSYVPVPGGTDAPGVVTYGEAFTVQPFANLLVTKTLTGQQVLDLLNQQVTLRRFLQPAGITWAYGPAGTTVNPAGVVIAGKPLDLAARYRITMNSFLADGGDGFSVFTLGTDTLVGGIDLDAFTAYLESRTAPIAPPATDRIRINP